MTAANTRGAAEVENELDTILEGIGEGFYAVDGAWRIRRFNREAERHFRVAARSVIGRNLWDVFASARDTPLGQQFLDTMLRRKAVASETPSVVIDNTWLSYRLFPLQDGLGVVFRDISDRKRAEQQRDLVIEELHHRLTNTFATVQAIASQSFRSSNVDASVRHAFEGRLQNLARAHTALANENWNGIALEELISTSLTPYSADNVPRFSIDGPSIILSARTAVALSMALHELSTNAVKYGALSTAEGRLSISWKVVNKRLSLIWAELGGPLVKPSARKGFGSAMLLAVLPQQLNGAVTIRPEESGLICEIDAALDQDGQGSDLR